MSRKSKGLRILTHFKLDFIVDKLPFNFTIEAKSEEEAKKKLIGYLDEMKAQLAE